MKLLLLLLLSPAVAAASAGGTTDTDSPAYSRCKDVGRCPRSSGDSLTHPYAPGVGFTHRVFAGGLHHAANVALGFDDWRAGSFGLVAPSTSQQSPDDAPGSTDATIRSAAAGLDTWALGDRSLVGPLYLNHSCDVTFDTDALTLSVACDAVPLLVDAEAATAACGNATLADCLSALQEGQRRNATTVAALPLAHSWLPALLPIGRPTWPAGYAAAPSQHAWLASYAPVLPFSAAELAASSCALMRASEAVNATAYCAAAAAAGGSPWTGGMAAQYMLPVGVLPHVPLSASPCGGADVSSQSSSLLSPWRILQPGFQLTRPVGVRVTLPAGGPTVAAFHFASFYLGRGARVRAVGASPLAIVSRTGLLLDTALVVTPGTLGVSGAAPLLVA